MQRSFLNALYSFLFFLVSTNAQELDPIKNMCIRFDQQSIIKNKTLYIDGGRQTFIDLVPQSPKRREYGNVTITEGYSTQELFGRLEYAKNGSDNYLIAVDLSTSWDWKTNVSETAIPKDKPSDSGTPVPVLSRGALYQGGRDDETFYLWGGTTSPWNKTFPGYRSPLSSQYALWKYNLTDQRWGQFDTGLTVENRPNSGAAAEAPDQGLAFYFNGMLDGHSQLGIEDKLDDAAKPFLDGMIVIDTANQTAKNISTKAVVGDYPRTRARMEYIEGVGDKGVLVLVGGNRKHISDYANQYVGDLLPMDELDIFDVASLYNSSTPDGTWYKQKATGDIPPARIDHCTIVASAPDGSSHNIYVIGGRSWNGTDNIVFDDVYILSLPSFIWKKVWQGKSPGYAHNCLRANANMMIRVGGAQNFQYDKLPCDWRPKGVSVLDISDIIWQSTYDAHATEYRIPPQVVAAIGGDRSGGATMRQPIKGFDQEGLAQIFRTTTKTSHRPRLRPSAPYIIGGIVGGVTIIGVAGGFVFFYRRRLHTFIRSGQWPRAEMDADGKADAEMEGNPVRLELPAPVKKFHEPYDKPVELCARDSDVPWKELKARDSDVPWEVLDGEGSTPTPPPPWEPPVTDVGVPF